MAIDAAALDPRQRFAQPVTGPSHRASFKLSAVSVLTWLVVYGVRVLRDAPATFHGVRLRGRRKAELYRASRVYPRLLADLDADLRAFGSPRAQGATA